MLPSNIDIWECVMTNFGKIVQTVDAVLNCIPIVSAVNCAAQALYKLAHKVDTLNPVAPGLKTSLKIHILNKNNRALFFQSIPILGNLLALGYLIISILKGFGDDLVQAVCRNDKEVVHLCLASNPLSDPGKAERILRLAAHSSNNETFLMILNHRQDWSSESLMGALKHCWGSRENTELNANRILDYWEEHKHVLDVNKVPGGIRALHAFLVYDRMALVDRVIGILPDDVPFVYMQDILVHFSCPQYNSKDEVVKTGVLTEEQRNALIAKSVKPSLDQLKDYYRLVGYSLKNMKTAANYRETHFDTLNRLLGLAQLRTVEIGDFIGRALAYDEFAFIESLVAKYERQLSAESKATILLRLFFAECDGSAHEKRAQLFASWIATWKKDLSPHALELYAKISRFGELHGQVDRLKQILLNAFPGCDRTPQRAVG